ncbi:MAG: hypothetical protein Q4A29_03860 [Eubacteriales bacterium]|nr:hypothetical protein [Eubacteriales bacterium]
MEKDLKQMLLNFLENFDAYEINEYFAWDFAEDCVEFEKINDSEEVLEYLNDAFYEIDTQVLPDHLLERKVKETIKTALEMIG